MNTMYFAVRNLFLSLILICCLFCLLNTTTFAVSTTSTSPISTLKILLKIDQAEISNESIALTLDCGKFGKFEYAFSKDTLEQSKDFDSNINASCKLAGNLSEDQNKKFKISFGDDQGNDNNYVSGTPAKEFNGKSMWAKLSFNTDPISSSSSVATPITNSQNSTSKSSISSTILETSSSSTTSKSSSTSTTISTKSSSNTPVNTSTSSKSTKSSSSSNSTSKSASSTKQSSVSASKSASSSKSSTTKSTQVKGATSLAKTGSNVNLIIYFGLIIFFGAFTYMSIRRCKIS